MTKGISGSAPQARDDLHGRLNQSRGNGQPLPDTDRSFMERRFGVDFSGVRAHTDSNAVQMSRELNAEAFTHGRDIYFGAGRYNPGTSAEKRLLAHELTHVVQQNGVSPLFLTGKNSENTMPNSQVLSIVSPEFRAPATIQRACGSIAIGPTPSHCNLVPKSPNGMRYLFRGGCDTFEVGQRSRLYAVAKALLSGATADILGMASSDGRAGFNESLSCHRADAAAAVFAASGKSSNIARIEATGEVPGTDNDANFRAVDIVIHSPTPTPPIPTATPPTPAPHSCTTPTNPDRSGRAFNPTTSGETAVCLLNPIDCNDAFDCRDTAFAAARTSGLIGPHLGPRDAFRHCVWSCCMAQKMGATEAEKFGTAHENSNPSSIPHDNKMDLHNNSMGRSLGAPSADCEAACRSAVTSGRLRTIRGPYTRPLATPPMTTTCIGASDQPWP